MLLGIKVQTGVWGEVHRTNYSMNLLFKNASLPGLIYGKARKPHYQHPCKMV